MADTTNYFFNRPTVGGSEDTWGADLNENWSKLDALLYGASYTDGDGNTVERIRPDLDEGQWAINGTAVTSTATELNLLDGVTWTLTGLNGLTATVTELNYTDGVTSNIQTQLDTLTSGKQPIDATLTNFAGVVWTANKVVVTTDTDVFTGYNLRDQDDMAANDAAGIPTQQSVKAYVDNSIAAIQQGWELVQTISHTAAVSGKVETATFAAGYEYMVTFADFAFTGDGTNRNIKLEVYKATSAAWHTSDQDLTNGSSSLTPTIRGNLRIPDSGRNQNYHHLESFVSLHNSPLTGDSAETSGDLRRLTWRFTSAERIGKIRVGQGSWTAASGTIYVYRRETV